MLARRDIQVVGVLIAYGDNLARTGLRALLNAERDMAVVGCATDGNQAVALAEEIQPDVLLVDIALPGIDGVELTRRLTADSSGAHALILSASETDEEVDSSLRAGASGFLGRDIEPAELVRAVRTVAAGNIALSPRVASRLIAELASRPDPGLPGPDELDDLTAREREVMALVAEGLDNDQIAELLVVSRATARTHVSGTPPVVCEGVAPDPTTTVVRRCTIRRMPILKCPRCEIRQYAAVSYVAETHCHSCDAPLARTKVPATPRPAATRLAASKERAR